MKQGFKLLTVLLMTLFLAASATAQINWLKQDGSIKYLAWDNGSNSKTIYNGNSATFTTGYFGSTINPKIVHMTVTINSKSDGKIVSTLVSKDVNVANSLGYEVITVLPQHYKNKAGEYIMVIKLKDANTELVDTSLYLKVNPGFVFDHPVPVSLNHAPVMSDIVPYTFTEGEKDTFVIFAWDVDKDDLKYEAEVCILKLWSCSYLNVNNDYVKEKFGASFKTESIMGIEYGVFSWTPGYDFVQHPNQEREVKLRFRADDGAVKSTWEEATITVKDVNRNPTFNPIGNKVVQEEQVLKFTVSAVDLDNDELTYSVLSLPPGAVFDPALQQFKWVPTNIQSGLYAVTFKVEDGFGGKDLENVLIQVMDLPMPKPQCDDGVDNDGDGVVDKNDPGCHTDGNQNNPGSYDSSDDDETDPVDVPECKDGKDNDGDGKIDFPGDPGCANQDDDDETDPVVDVPECKDRLDNDNDGAVDLHDPGCTSPEDDDESDDPIPQCNDGKDNDGDGKKDYPNDPGCQNKDDENEADDPENKPQCDDTVDNDRDGKIDYPNDAGCSNKDDDNESDDPIDEPECKDGKDNDGDGKKDYSNDPGCSNKDDDNESDDPLPQCNDGKDNDADGKKDYPNDPGCQNKDDNNEINAEYPVDTSAPMPLTNIKFKSVFIKEEIGYAGDTMVVNVNIFNNGKTNLEDVKVIATIYDIGAWGSTSDFDLSKGKGANKSIYVSVPEEVQPGWYLVKVTAKNSHHHTSTYRLVYINGYTFKQYLGVPTQ